MPKTYLEGVLLLARKGKNVLNSSGWTMQLTSCVMYPSLDYSFFSNSNSNNIYSTDHCQAQLQTRLFHFYQGGSPLLLVGTEDNGDDLACWAEPLSYFEQLGVSEA